MGYLVKGYFKVGQGVIATGDRGKEEKGMARPKVHVHGKRTSGLRISVPLHDALRNYNRDTGVPSTKGWSCPRSVTLRSWGIGIRKRIHPRDWSDGVDAFSDREAVRQ
jgi:hypothetical protein